MKSAILKCLKKFDTQPFLFVGSGLSIRYLGLENWEGLLRKFARAANNNEYAYELYLQQAKVAGYKEGVLPKVAELIENDFNQRWFQDDEFKESRNLYKEDIKKLTSPFKIEIARHMKERSSNTKEEYKDEIVALQKIGKRSIGGVLTTNYDCFLESIFNDYAKYIGQEELIFSTIQGVAEIYKIHGCCTKPKSIVINENDYVDFADRNAYLAAKILTIFLEHPVIFLGYSINDNNIENIMKAIVKCLSPDNLAKLKERLIFIEWNNSGQEDDISTYSKSFEGGKSIEMTRIRLKNYEVLYQALLENKAKYNAPMLRRLKEDIYELVLTNKPTGKIRTVGLEDERLEDVEVVIGVGVLAEFGKKGYSLYTAEEIYRDVVFDDMNLEADLVVHDTLPVLLKHHGGSIPIYKYISQVEGELPPKVDSEIKHNYEDLLNRTIKSNTDYLKLPYKSVNDLRKVYSDVKCLQLIPLLGQDRIDISELHDFLRDIMTKQPDLITNGKINEKINLRRIIKIFDWLKYYNKAKELRT
ncbi:MAG: SIR2 family protein [Clostridia bacterium]|nr:SIR2 family protein [Clostridia bacterium]